MTDRISYRSDFMTAAQCRLAISDELVRRGYEPLPETGLVLSQEYAVQMLNYVEDKTMAGEDPFVVGHVTTGHTMILKRGRGPNVLVKVLLAGPRLCIVREPRGRNGYAEIFGTEPFRLVAVNMGGK